MNSPETRAFLDADAILDRAKELVGVSSDAALGRFMGRPRTTVSNWRQRGTIPLNELAEIALALGASLDWLLAGRGPGPGTSEGETKRQTPAHSRKNRATKTIGADRFGTTQWEDPTPPQANPEAVSARSGEAETLVRSVTCDPEEARPGARLTDGNLSYVLVPRYDVQASAGAGAVLVESEQIVDYLAFREDWVRGHMGLKPDRLALIEAIGDSMTPTIGAGDLMLVDLERAHVREDAIYIVRKDDTLLAKRCQLLAAGGLQLRSDNEAYAPETVPPERLAEVDLIGRVVWAGKRM